MSMRQFCPNCHGELEYESIGMKCTKCKGFIDMHGNFHKYVERPFMPPKTNFLKITESVESLAEFIDSLNLIDCNACVGKSICDCHIRDCKEVFIKWLQVF